MKKIEELFDEIERVIPCQDKVNASVSKGSVGWHVEHVLLTINMIIMGLKGSQPALYKARFDIRRMYVMATGRIPRGRIKAPSVVQPTVQYNRDSLTEHLALTRAGYESLKTMDANHFFTHPFLGDFKLKPTIRFLQIHTAHHLAIVNDILKKEEPR